MSLSILNSYINPNVLTVGVSKLRALNASKLKDIDKTLIIQENEKPLAVLLKYEEFLSIQKQLIAILQTHAVASDQDVTGAILSGLSDSEAGRTKNINEVRKSLPRGIERHRQNPVHPAKRETTGHPTET